MGELTNDVPKPLLKISVRPILEYTLNNLPEEISEIVFIVGYKGELIRRQFGEERKQKNLEKLFWGQKIKLISAIKDVFLGKIFLGLLNSDS